MFEKLNREASKLTPPSLKAQESYSKDREKFVTLCSQKLLKRDDLESLIGKNNIEMAKDNNNNFSLFMESLFSDYNTEVFIGTVLWVFKAYRSHGFNTTYWAANLNIWINVLKDSLEQNDFDQIYPFYNWLIVNIPIFVKLSNQRENIQNYNSLH